MSGSPGNSHRQRRKQKNRRKRIRDGAFLYGKNSILERVRVNPASIRAVYYSDKCKDKGLLDRIHKKKIPLEKVTESRLTRLKKADRLQGIIARVDSFQYTPAEALIEDAAAEGRTVLCLDSINDPHNLGSILRVTACFGNISVVIPRYSACEVTDTVMHVASGGENYVPLAVVNNLAHVITAVKENGYTVAGTIVEKGEDLNTVAFPFPLCLILGSEGKGIRAGLKQHCDIAVRIYMHGANLSFNVAVACAIFCHEMTKQRLQKKKRDEKTDNF